MSRSVEIKGFDGRSSNFEYACKAFKRTVEKSGVITECKNNRTHTKQAERNKLAKLAARGRAARLVKDQQRELVLSSNLMCKELGRRRAKPKPKFGKKFAPRREA